MTTTECTCLGICKVLLQKRSRDRTSNVLSLELTQMQAQVLHVNICWRFEMLHIAAHLVQQLPTCHWQPSRKAVPSEQLFGSHLGKRSGLRAHLVSQSRASHHHNAWPQQNAAKAI